VNATPRSEIVKVRRIREIATDCLVAKTFPACTHKTVFQNALEKSNDVLKVMIDVTLRPIRFAADVGSQPGIGTTPTSCFAANTEVKHG